MGSRNKKDLLVPELLQNKLGEADSEQRLARMVGWTACGSRGGANPVDMITPTNERVYSEHPLDDLLAEEFRKRHPDEYKKIDVPETIGSTGAIQAAADGAIAVGLISRGP